MTTGVMLVARQRAPMVRTRCQPCEAQAKSRSITVEEAEAATEEEAGDEESSDGDGDEENGLRGSRRRDAAVAEADEVSTRRHSS